MLKKENRVALSDIPNTAVAEKKKKKRKKET